MDHSNRINAEYIASSRGIGEYRAVCKLPGCVEGHPCVSLSLSEYRLCNMLKTNMHTVFVLLCFVVVIHWLIFPYPSGLLHWHCGNLTIAPVPAKQPWWIWINTSCEFIMNNCITTTKQSTTKPCAYFLGYTVSASADWIFFGGMSLSRRFWHVTRKKIFRKPHKVAINSLRKYIQPLFCHGWGDSSTVFQEGSIKKCVWNTRLTQDPLWSRQSTDECSSLKRGKLLVFDLIVKYEHQNCHTRWSSEINKISQLLFDGHMGTKQALFSNIQRLAYIAVQSVSLNKLIL